jgi:hypothetical protein
VGWGGKEGRRDYKKKELFYVYLEAISPVAHVGFLLAVHQIHRHDTNTPT